MICPYFLHSQCSSCNLLDKSYSETLSIKEEELRKLFKDECTNFLPTVALLNDAQASRTKAKFAVFNQNNQITFGFYGSDGTPHELELCPLHADGINALLPGIRDILKSFKILPYDLENKTGELKYLLISKSQSIDHCHFLLRFVLRSKESLDRLKKAAAMMLKQFPEILVITANIQPVHQAIIEGDQEIVLTKDPSIIHQFDEFKLALGARSFFQVTPEIAKKLYNTVADTIAIDSPESLIDLYCGVGAFSFYASRHCKDISGIEISKEAIDCANSSLLLNDSNIHFIAQDAQTYLKENHKKYEALLVNPPRRGLNSDIIKMILEMSPKFIYYSSCNAQSMSRDFSELKEKYIIKSLQIFDMFPYTSHFETLMCLIKK